MPGTELLTPDSECTACKTYYFSYQKKISSLFFFKYKLGIWTFLPMLCISWKITWIMFGENNVYIFNN